jgi:hypothetical protein
MNQGEYQEILDACGGSCEPIANPELPALLKAWREVYAVGLFAATGRWKLGPYEWHVFSFDHAHALNGEKGLAEYGAQQPGVVVVYPEGLRLPAVRLTGERLPSFERHIADVYIWPEDLAWTMAFTHEASTGLGPYFSRCEWMDLPGDPSAQPQRRRAQKR